MERRNWSLESFSKLKYIDSLDGYEKAHSLELWSNEYLLENFLELIDLDDKDLKLFLELFYKNINFLKEYKELVYKELKETKNIKKFLS